MILNTIRQSKALILAATLGLAPQASHAQTVPDPSNGDIFIGFRASEGDGASTSYVVKVANQSQLSEVATGSTITLPGLSNLAGDLSATFGSNWSTRPTLYWGAFGIGSPASATLYGSREHRTTGSEPLPWPSLSDTARASTYSQLNSVINSVGGYRSSAATENSSVATLQSNFSGAASYNYQVGSPGTTDFGSVSQWTNIEGSFGSGASGSSLNLFRFTSAGVSRVGSFSISSGGALTFTALSAAPAAPQFASHPSNANAYLNGGASFSVTATGGWLTYQWRKGTDELTDGAGISGSNRSTLVLTNLQPSDSGNYNVVVTNTVGTATSNDGVLFVSNLPAPPEITSALTKAGVVGKSFSYQISGSNSPVSFGATGLPAGLNVNADTGLISGTPTSPGISTVTLSATNAGGTDTAALQITVRATPTISTNPVPKLVIAGGTVTFTVAATGDNLSYQWFKDDLELEDNSRISGSTTKTLTITNATAADAGAYNVVVTNLAGDTPSALVDLTVNPVPATSAITIRQAANALRNGASTIDFGSVVARSPGKPLAFTIKNAGAANLSGLAVSSTGTSAGQFTVTQPSVRTLTPGGSTTFTVTFKPTTDGSKSAVIKIASNDANDNPFIVAVRGNATPFGPEIAVEQPVGSGLVSGTASKSFGTSAVGKVGKILTFTIRNPGSAPLKGIKLSLAGLNPSDFLVVNPSKTTVAVGGTITFKIKFKPTARGKRAAVLRIASNDADEKPFKIKLAGTGK